MSIWAEVKGKMRPVTEARQITRGNRRGWWEILLPDGKKAVVEHVRVCHSCQSNRNYFEAQKESAEERKIA